MELTWQHFLELPRTRESILMWSACLSSRGKNFKIQKTERKKVITFLSCNLDILLHVLLLKHTTCDIFYPAQYILPLLLSFSLNFIRTLLCCFSSKQLIGHILFVFNIRHWSMLHLLKAALRMRLPLARWPCLIMMRLGLTRPKELGLLPCNNNINL